MPRSNPFGRGLKGAQVSEGRHGFDFSGPGTVAIFIGDFAHLLPIQQREQAETC